MTDLQTTYTQNTQTNKHTKTHPGNRKAKSILASSPVGSVNLSLFLWRSRSAPLRRSSRKKKTQKRKHTKTGEKSQQHPLPKRPRLGPLKVSLFVRLLHALQAKAGVRAYALESPADSTLSVRGPRLVWGGGLGEASEGGVSFKGEELGVSWTWIFFGRRSLTASKLLEVWRLVKDIQEGELGIPKSSRTSQSQVECTPSAISWTSKIGRRVMTLTASHRCPAVPSPILALWIAPGWG